jgi:DNA-directed RNA polymerase specialized sigma24 family protein
MTEGTLLARIEEYRACGTPERKDRAVAALIEYLYESLFKFRLDGLTDDTRSDFILWMYPRFPGIVEQFNPERASFKTYLNWVVRLSYRTFIRNLYSREARQRIYEIEETARLRSVEDEWCDGNGTIAGAAEKICDYELTELLEKTAKLSEKQRTIFNRKVFLLACKAGNYLDDAQIKQVAAVIGCGEESLREKIDQLRQECGTKHDRQRRTEEKINGYYVRSQRCLYEMKLMDKDSARYESLRKEYDYCVKRLETVRHQAKRHIRVPSNRQLAATLGISRGTIDSTLASAFHHEYPDAS